jgi:uncharacterized phage protein gp47/JayE
MATYPLATLSASVSEQGISAPSYNDILSSLQASFRSIYGEDAYLEPDSQDGQLLAIFAKAIHDCNQTAISVYNSFSPGTAQGEALSSRVKMNHMQRQVATNSQVNVTLVGQAGTTITSGAVGDDNGGRWLLPVVVTIPPGGTITVTATAEKPGATPAPIGSVTNILTPTAGWQSATNPSSATLGAPVESDAALRRRQEVAPSLNSYSVLQGLAASINALPGVTYGKVYENDTGTADANGLPAHSISCVVRGGVAADIAQTIYSKKGPGVATHGSTSIPITDVSGAVRNINFFVPVETAIKVSVSLVAGDGYTTAVADLIKAAVAAYINSNEIGEDVVVTRLYGPALLNGKLPESESYKITLLQAALAPSGTLATADIVIPFNAKAVCSVADVSIVTV